MSCSEKKADDCINVFKNFENYIVLKIQRLEGKFYRTRCDSLLYGEIIKIIWKLSSKLGFSESCLESVQNVSDRK